MKTNRSYGLSWKWILNRTPSVFGGQWLAYTSCLPPCRGAFEANSSCIPKQLLKTSRENPTASAVRSDPTPLCQRRRHRPMRHPVVFRKDVLSKQAIEETLKYGPGSFKDTDCGRLSQPWGFPDSRGYKSVPWQFCPERQPLPLRCISPLEGDSI